MRVGQNPAKSIDQVAQPARVTVAVVSYIPFLGGYYDDSLDVLKVCLDSIWENTPEPFDLLVFDNASCSEVRDYLVELHSRGRIQYLVLSDKNVGKGGAWNFIFGASPGEVIAYADSDIRFYQGWLEHTLAILEAFPKAGMVTARPMRSPERFYTSTLEWAQQTEQVGVTHEATMPWEVYRQHILSLGTSEEQAREWYDGGKDWRLTYQTVQAQVGAAHFQFAGFKTVLQQFLPFRMDRPMGQVRSLDEQMNAAGYLRLSTCQPLVMHMGNTIGDQPMEASRPEAKKGRSRWYEQPWIKRPLLKVYDAIFKLYYH